MANTITPVRFLHRAFCETSDYGTSPWYNPGAPFSVNATDTLWDDRWDRQKRSDWRDKLQKGQDASNYYFRSGTSYQNTPARGEVWTPSPYGTRSRGSYAWIGSHPTRLTTSTDLADIALKRVKRKIASLEESYQALIPLAELREARGLIRQMVDLTTDMVKAVADLKRTKGKSLFRYVQDRWLIYSFGISPMMADLHGLGESLWAFLTKGDVRDRVQGTAGKTWLASSSDLLGTVTGLPQAPIVWSSNAVHTLSYRYVAGWKFLIRSGNDYSAARHFGIFPAALIPALWETTAYSWVVDYFTTVGDWLEDIFTGSAGTSMYVVQNRKYQYLSECAYWYKAASGSYMTTSRVGKTVVSYFEFERTPLSALPSRTLRFKTLDEIGNNALTKLLNLASLTFRGRRWSDV